jgi:hypothetical protein
MPNVEVQIFPGILHGYMRRQVKAFSPETRAFTKGRAQSHCKFVTCDGRHSRARGASGTWAPRRSIPIVTTGTRSSLMTTMLTNDADLRVLQADELDAVTGGQKGSCEMQVAVIPIGDKGTLVMGTVDCFGYGIPFAQWHPK